MAEYKIIDEFGHEEKPIGNPWSPEVIFLFTIFTGPLFGGIMGVMNYDRLRIKGNKKKVAIVLIFASIVLTFLPILGFETWGMRLTKDISDILRDGTKYVLALYLLGTQRKAFQYHIERGGDKAGIKTPILLGAGFVLVVILAGSAFLISGPELRNGNITKSLDNAASGEIGKYNTTVYAGSSPAIDGTADDRDAWYEGEQNRIEVKGKKYTVTTKHDFENLYILMEWNGAPEWDDMMAIYFEQDNGTPDFNLSNGRVDNYYQGHYKYGPESISDAHHYESGYTVMEEHNGLLRAGYRNGTWTLEWQVPLRSGDAYDIYVDKYPMQLGFSIINNRGGAYGIWPPGADLYKAGTWGNMMISGIKKQ